MKQQGIFTIGLAGLSLLAVMSVAVASPGGAANLYVYELPDGSRIVTDHALNNKHYRLVRTGSAVQGVGKLVASQNSQLFRADPSAYDDLIRRTAAEHKVDVALVKAVMHVESNFNPYAKSDRGALGLMQLQPETARRHGVEDVYDPAQNIRAGVLHLKYLSELFNNKLYLVLAAYNAGENAVRRHHGIPPYAETQAYVRKVLHLKTVYSKDLSATKS